MRLDDLKDEEVVAVDQGVVVQAAFEIRVAFGDQRRADLGSLLRCEATFGIRTSSPAVTIATPARSRWFGRYPTGRRLAVRRSRRAPPHREDLARRA